MGLAPYGEPKYVQTIKEHLVEIREDGSLWMNIEYFTYPHGLTMTGEKFGQLFDGPARKPEAKLTQREMDLARSVQDITEEVMLNMARFARRETGMRDLCLAGGVALNCVGNGRILREGVFDQLWIQPAAGDAGGALGVALSLWHRYLNKPRRSPEMDGAWERQGVGAGGAGEPGRPGEAGRAGRAGGAVPIPKIRRRHERLVPRAAVFSRRDPAFDRRRRLGGHAGRWSGARRPRGGASGGRKSRRTIAGSNGVWTARPWRALDSGRRPFAEDAIGDERQNQVQGVIPAVCARGVA